MVVVRGRQQRALHFSGTAMELDSTHLERVEATNLAGQVVLGNLLQLYIHDLSEAFPWVELGHDGRFGYPELASYWAEPARRFAFLIKQADKVAGFALVTRGSPATEEPDVYDIAEFFVLRSFRRAGVGRRAALLLWKELTGAWTVRCSEANPSALTFWSRLITELTRGAATVSARPGKTSQFRVFRFDVE